MSKNPGSMSSVPAYMLAKEEKHGKKFANRSYAKMTYRLEIFPEAEQAINEAVGMYSITPKKGTQSR